MSTGRSFVESVIDGFNTPEELLEIEDLMEKKRLIEAREKAIALAKKPSDYFASDKRERYMRGYALYYSGQISAELGDRDDAIQQMEAAVDLGHPYAAYDTAALLLIQGTASKTPIDTDALRDKVFHYYLIGAELGYAVCIDHIQVALRAKGEESKAHYWFLLQRMSESADDVRRYRHFQNTEFTKEDRLFLRQVMKTESLSGGALPSTIAGLPRRSTLVSAYVDLLMRKQLRFVWMAFFEDSGVAESYPLTDVFNAYRDSTRDNPLADLFLLVNERYASDESAIALSSDQLLENTLAGDQVVVRCGRMVHYAIVWAVDRKNQKVLLLDPFDEFWQPSHNPCITFFERKSYKGHRHLVNLLLPEFQSMIVAVMTIRDRT
jgi:tetratricopeptide (TPR) repeat protein